MICSPSALRCFARLLLAALPRRVNSFVEIWPCRARSWSSDEASRPRSKWRRKASLHGKPPAILRIEMPEFRMAATASVRSISERSVHLEPSSAMESAPSLFTLDLAQSDDGYISARNFDRGLLSIESDLLIPPDIFPRCELGGVRCNVNRD